MIKKGFYAIVPDFWVTVRPILLEDGLPAKEDSINIIEAGTQLKRDDNPAKELDQLAIKVGLPTFEGWQPLKQSQKPLVRGLSLLH